MVQISKSSKSTIWYAICVCWALLAKDKIFNYADVYDIRNIVRNLGNAEKFKEVAQFLNVPNADKEDKES